MVNNKAQKTDGVRATLAGEQHLQHQNHFEALNIISNYKLECTNTKSQKFELHILQIHLFFKLEDSGKGSDADEEHTGTTPTRI